MKPTYPASGSLGFNTARLKEMELTSSTDSSSPTIHRRDMLKLGATLLAGSMAASRSFARPQTNRPKKIIIAGGGITGLSCGYELMKRGHEVVVLEAAGRAGGTCEHSMKGWMTASTPTWARNNSQNQATTCTGSTCRSSSCRISIIRVVLGLLRFIDGKFRTDEDLHNRSFVSKLGFNQARS